MTTLVRRNRPFLMSDTPTQQQFGLIVAYILPGFIGLAGVVPLVPAVGQWLAPVNQGDAGFGPPIYALLLATTIGMIIGCFRWLIVDHLLEWTGVPKATTAYKSLPDKLQAFDYLNEGHYRFYQFYGATLIAVLWAYLSNRVQRSLPLLGLGTDLGAFILCAVLLAGSRDALMKHRRKVSRVLD